MAKTKKNLGWKTKKENLKYEDWRFKIYHNDVLAPDGQNLQLSKILIKPGAHLVGLTKNKKILLIKQYRYPNDCIFIEIPGGGVDDKESYKDAAIREFTEEVGYLPKNVQFVGRFQYSPSLNFPIEVYFSDDLVKTQTKHESSEQGSEVVEFTYDECQEMIQNGEICDFLTIATLAICKTKGFI